MLAGMNVLCVTPNTSVDRILTVPGYQTGGVSRASTVSAVCGGKGVNVARAVSRLGHRAVCSGLLAGHSGRYAAEAANGEGLEACWTWVAGETRTCVIIVSDGASTVVNEPGVAVGADDWRRFVSDVAGLAAQADAVCVSGSMPTGRHEGGAASLVEAGRQADRSVWIDSSGQALADAITAHPHGVKINGDEAGALLGQTISGAGDAIAAVGALRSKGVGTVAVTLGAEGAVLGAGEGTWRSKPPDVSAVNPTGAGDCFLAALVVALHNKGSLAEALRWATAVSAADVLQQTAGRFELFDANSLMAAVEVTAVDV